MSEVTYTTNFNLAKPPKGWLDWDDENNGNFDIIDGVLGKGDKDRQQIANDLYANPAPAYLTQDPNDTQVIYLTPADAADYAEGDTVEIEDDDTAAAQFTVESVSVGAGTIAMTTAVSSAYSIAQNAKIRRLNKRLNGDGLQTLNVAVVDSISPTELLRPVVTGLNRVLTVLPAVGSKSDGSKVYAFISGDSGANSEYVGGAVDFGTGVVTGGGDNFTPPAIGSDYITALIAINSSDELVVIFGLQAATYVDARSQVNRALGGSEDLSIARVTLRGDGGGSFKVIRTEDVEDLRPFLNVGGGGSGNASETLERLKDTLGDSTFEWMTPNIFTLHKEDRVASATATYNSTKKGYVYSAISQNVESINLVDPQFISELNSVISRVAIIGFWNLSALDADATWELSNDDGTTWEEVQMNHILGTDTVEGYHVFEGAGVANKLKVKVTSSQANVILKGFGILYGEAFGPVYGYYSKEAFIFDGEIENLNEFTVSRFLPDPDLVKVYWANNGKVFVYPDFAISGHTITFPEDIFNDIGEQRVIIEQTEGAAFDNSDKNASLMTENHLGSSDAGVDRSLPGRGIILRRPDGTLREITIDNDDNIVIKEV